VKTRRSQSNLQRRLAADPACRRLRSFRDTAAAILNLEPYPLGVPGLLRWLVARENKGLNRGCEQAEGVALTALAWKAALMHKTVLTKAAAVAVAEQDATRERRVEQKQQLLVQREAQRRAGDRQPVTLVPIITTTSAAPAPRGSHSRQARGPMGRRLEKKLDRLLAEVRELMAAGAPEATAAAAAMAELPAAAEPEALAPQIGDPGQPGPEATTPAVAGDLADPPATLASPAPETLAPQPGLQPLAESATADLHQQVLVAAAQGLLEPALAEPLPVSIHALEAAWAAEPAAAAALAELSPRARAIAELGAALLQGGQSITLSTAAAATLMEALVG
jgi:hypothetical protein